MGSFQENSHDDSKYHDSVFEGIYDATNLRSQLPEGGDQDNVDAMPEFTI